MVKLNVGGIELVLNKQSFEQNLEFAISKIRSVRDERKGGKLQVLCLPELFSTGFDVRYLKSHAASVFEKTLPALQDTAKYINAYIIAGLPYATDGVTYNCLFVINREGNVVEMYKKAHMKMNDSDETSCFKRPSLEAKVLSIDGVSVGLAICYDLRFPEITRLLALKGAQLTVVAAAWPSDKTEMFKTLAGARAIENQQYVFAINLKGSSMEMDYGGGSAIYGPSGNVESSRISDLIIGEIDTEVITKTRTLPDCLADRHDKYNL